MKKLIRALIFIVLTASVFQANSQTVILDPEDSNLQKITHITTIESRYYEGKVYLHLTVNGNTETQTVAIERSLDAMNYEVIGFVTIFGVKVHGNIAYYYTDNSPVIANLYYRLSFNTLAESAYSKTINIIPIDISKTNIDVAIATPACNDAGVVVGAGN